MAKKVTVTNLASGPRGWPEINGRPARTVKPGDSIDLVVADSVFDGLKRLEADGLVDLEVIGKAPEPVIEPRGSEGIAPEDAQVLQDQIAAHRQAIEERDETIERQAEEIARLTNASEPRTYQIGTFVEGALKAAGLENLSDLQAALDAIEARFAPFAAFDPDGDGRPGGKSLIQVALEGKSPEEVEALLKDALEGQGDQNPAGAEQGSQETQNPAVAGSPAGAEDDAFETMSDDDLRTFIEKATQKAPHPAAKRETLLKKAREIDADEAEAV